MVGTLWLVGQMSMDGFRYFVLLGLPKCRALSHTAFDRNFGGNAKNTIAFLVTCFDLAFEYNYKTQLLIGQWA